MAAVEQVHVRVNRREDCTTTVLYKTTDKKTVVVVVGKEDVPLRRAVSEQVSESCPKLTSRTLVHPMLRHPTFDRTFTQTEDGSFN